LLAALALSAVLGPAAPAQSPPDTDEQVRIDADQLSYDQKTDTVVAKGNVIITRGDFELRAEEVRVNRTTNAAEAHGSVQLEGPQGSGTADHAFIDLTDETGLLEHATIDSHTTQYSFWGDRVQKGAGQTYHIENGRFTPCRCGAGAPTWSISGRDVQLNLRGYGTVRGGTFNVLDTPVLYIPRAFFPISQERQTGFLAPRFGYSSLRGFQTYVPFYWALNRSHDLSLSGDVESSARVGTSAHYRYILDRATAGSLYGSYFNETFRGQAKSDGNPVPENRWNLLASHSQTLPTNTLMYADGLMVSDDRFLRDMNLYAFDLRRDVTLRSLPFDASRVGLLHEWERLALRAEGTYYQNLTGADSTTLQRAPTAYVWGQSLLAHTPLLGDIQASATDYVRGSDVDGLRLDVAPRVELPVRLGNVAYGGVRGAFRSTAYNLYDQTVASSGDRLPANPSRQTAQVDAGLRSTFDRVYTVRRLGIEKLKHTLEPSLSYLYVPAVNQDDLPLFDGLDRINRRNLITYGIASRFIARSLPTRHSDAADTPDAEEEGSIRELGRLWVNQSFDISRKIPPLQSGRSSDHFSDIDIGALVHPSPSLFLRFDGNYNTGNTEFSAARLAVFAEERRDPSRAQGLGIRNGLGASYSVLTKSLLQELNGNLVLRLTDRAGFRYVTRYDVVTNTFLGSTYSLRLVSACDCWILDAGMVQKTNPTETQALLQFSLFGFGAGQGRPFRARVP
jgi:LPS-assembly protein